MDTILNYINGDWTAAQSGIFLANKNPATGESYSQVPDSDSADADLAISAAHAAFAGWSKTAVKERADRMRHLAQLIHDNAEQLARYESMDNGKPLKLAQSVDIPRSEYNFRFFADLIVGLHGEAFRSDLQTMSYTEYSPLGPVVCWVHCCGKTFGTYAINGF
jgi:aminomuconate-semialdehyde/2-hydroxymuconate-6-semialdehyde dehydrogenase